MPYLFDLETDFSTEPFCDNMGTEIVEFALGYDIEENLTVIMSVMLVPGASYLGDKYNGIYDLRFGLRSRDLNHVWKVTGPDYTRERMRQYIPRDFRHHVRSCILVAIQGMVEKVAPLYLTMETYYGNLPDKAMTKYHDICGLLNRNGYQISDAFRDRTSGKNYWFLSRTI